MFLHRDSGWKVSDNLRNHIIPFDITQLLKGEDIAESGWTGKEQLIQEDFIWGAGPEALYQITQPKIERTGQYTNKKRVETLF